MDQCVRILKILFIVALLASGALPVQSAPTPVEVGIYLNNIQSVSLKEKRFQVDFNIWFRWKSDHINPMETFKIYNGNIDAKDGLVMKKINGINYAVQRIQATIYRNFNVDRYPLDDHKLKIQIENPVADTNFEFVPDNENSSVSPKIMVPGWSVGSFDGYASITTYKTNHGDISLGNDAEAKVPRYTFSVDLKREGYGLFFKYFSVLFFSVALTLIAFWISAELIDTRYWLVTTSPFLVVLIADSLSATLPDSESFRLGDQLYMLSVGLIFVAATVMIYQAKLFTVDEQRAKRQSFIWGWGLTMFYTAASVWIVLKG